MVVHGTQAGGSRPVPRKPSFASRLFGYDIFLSFALGSPPRGTQSYASDLARRLREHEFNVFFSEEEAPPGTQLEKTLRDALLDSKTLVVIANRGTLEDPRWVRKEVEEFREHRAARPVIVINVGGALQDPRLAAVAKDWLGYEGKIWLDESEETVVRGIADEEIVTRLATTPAWARTTTKWRRTVGAVLISLSVLTIATGIAAWIAFEAANEAQARQLVAESRALETTDPDQAHLVATLAFERKAMPATEAQVKRAYVKAEGLSLTLHGHSGSVRSARFSQDGRYVVTTGLDKSAKLWLVSTGALVASLDQNGPVTRAEISRDGKLLVTGNYFGEIRVWLVEEKRLLPLLKLEKGNVFDSRLSPDGRFVLAATSEKTARMWETATGKLVATYPSDGGTPTSVSFSDDSRLLAIVSTNGNTSIYDTNGNLKSRLKEKGTSRALPTFAQMGGTRQSAEFSRDGKRILIVGGAAKIWSVEDGRLIATLNEGTEGVDAARFSEDGNQVVTGSLDGTLRVWSAKNGTLKISLKGHGSGIRAVTFDRTSKYVLTSSDDHTAKIWSTRDGTMIASLEGHGAEVKDADWTRDGSLIVTASDDRTAKIWSVAAIIARDLPAPRSISTWGISADRTVVIAGGIDGAAQVWSLANGRLAATLSGHEDSIVLSGFSSNGELAVTASRDGTACAWSVADGTQLHRVTKRDGALRGAVFRGDGTQVVMFGDKGPAQVWSLRDAHFLADLKEDAGSITSAKYDKTGGRVLTTSTNGSATLWSLPDGRPLQRLRGHKKAIIGAQFSDDGTMIVTAGADGVAKVWRPPEEDPLAVLGDHHGWVVRAIFSTDGRYVATADSDRVVRVWAARTGRLLATMSRHEHGITDIAFDSRSELVATASSSQVNIWTVRGGTHVKSFETVYEVFGVAFIEHDLTLLAATSSGLRLWKCPFCKPVSKLIEEIRARTGRDLTDRERERLGLSDSGLRSLTTRMLKTQNIGSR